MSPLFKYHTRDEKGVARDGTIEALDEQDTVKKLQEQGLIVIAVEMAVTGKPEIVKEIPNIPREEKQHTDKKIIFLYGFLAFFCLAIAVLIIFVNIKTHQEKDFFEKAKADNKIESYREFLKRYPKGKFAEQAQEEMLAVSNKPNISEIFKTQLMKFLEEGAKTNAEASQGVSYMELREQVANTVAAYDLLSATWPINFSVNCRGDFDRALKGWDLTLELWKLKVNEKNNPVEPNINGYARYLAFGGENLVIEIYTWDRGVEAYRGKKYMPFDENISVLLTIAGASFNSGRDKILRELQ